MEGDLKLKRHSSIDSPGKGTQVVRTMAASPQKFIADPFSMTARTSFKTAYTSASSPAPIVTHFMNGTTNYTSMFPAENCPYNTSTAKQKFSFPKSTRFPNFQR